MYKVIFYENKPGYSQLFHDIDELANKAILSKDARIQHAQIVLCIRLLKECDTRIGSPYTKHLIDELWELRPGKNRILYFYRNGAFVLLHMFRKKGQKTPTQEINKGLKEINDYINKQGEQ